MVVVLIITAEWDYFKDQLESLCRALERHGIKCEILDYRDERALDLLLKYCIINGLIRIPQILLVSNGHVKRFEFKVNEELRIDIDGLLKALLNEAKIEAGGNPHTS